MWSRVLTKLGQFPLVAAFLRSLFVALNQVSYRAIVRLATAMEGGDHPKHRLTRYHDFFIENVADGQRVLDVGCGTGRVLQKIAAKVKSPVVGVDISKDNCAKATANLSGVANASVICADIYSYSEEGGYDVIILSNVLEHLQNRVGILAQLLSRFRPHYFLIRIPMYERDWLVAYKKELGKEWRLDSTHVTEYTEESLRRELSDASLRIESIRFRWGEMYVKAVPISC